MFWRSQFVTIAAIVVSHTLQSFSKTQKMSSPVNFSMITDVLKVKHVLSVVPDLGLAE